MKKQSFTKWFHAVMADREFHPDDNKRLCWRKDGTEATMFVCLQKASFAPGYYVNYYVAFNALSKGIRPEVDESITDSRNPACFNRTKKVRMQDLLDHAADLVTEPRIQAEFLGILDEQLTALYPLATVHGLRDRLKQEPPLDMYVMTKYLAQIQ